ncbi:unnamed protein product [Cylicocyclus nassatus]|uniref:N-terminal E2 ubiquitin-conjugating enzyme n=1 Tax=Cylicocyclus nassatus TaxID=53992 RepID=A0AA36GM82_CYLNA|nr:unnamed protein product [Cylicocyclus nassatus]
MYDDPLMPLIKLLCIDKAVKSNVKTNTTTIACVLTSIYHITLAQKGSSVFAMSLDASSRRLMKELQQLSTEPPTGIVVNKDAASSDLKQWRVDVIGAAGTLYEGEKFSLQFRFSQQYPFNSPEVMFVGENIPVHPHVYSNGHICLSILSEDWTPALSVQAVCLSILSMLSSAREKKRPPDNALYVRTCNKNPSKTRWWFHAYKSWPY